jgi:hypothetical protein
MVRSSSSIWKNDFIGADLDKGKGEGLLFLIPLGTVYEIYLDFDDHQPPNIRIYPYLKNLSYRRQPSHSRKSLLFWKWNLIEICLPYNSVFFPC